MDPPVWPDHTSAQRFGALIRSEGKSAYDSVVVGGGRDGSASDVEQLARVFCEILES